MPENEVLDSNEIAKLLFFRRRSLYSVTCRQNGYRCEDMKKPATKQQEYWDGAACH